MKPLMAAIAGFAMLAIVGAVFVVRETTETEAMLRQRTGIESPSSSRRHARHSSEGVEPSTKTEASSVATPPTSDTREPTTIARSENPTSTPTATASSPTTAEPAPTSRTSADAVDEAFDRFERSSKSADDAGQELLALSDDEERIWGRRMHEQFLTEHRVVENQAWNGRIIRVAAPILKNRLRRPIEYKFTVIESDNEDLNAFSIAGGYIYIHQALMKWVQSDDELQFVLGHEIGHVDLGHCGSRATFVARASQVAPDSAVNAIAILHGVISRAYTKDQEFDADRYALLAMMRLGRTKDQAMAFPRRFQEFLRKKGIPDEPMETDNSAFGTFVRRVDNHFQSHPNYAERVRRLEKTADAAQW
jgi:Zn-dependent protease with chaperone function